jgi:hypothetical protein
LVAQLSLPAAQLAGLAVDIPGLEFLAVTEVMAQT